MPGSIVIVLKTNQGGMWIIPHIAALGGRGFRVVVILPEGRGRLREALEALQVDVVGIDFDFTFGPSLRTLRGLAKLRTKIREAAPVAVFYHLYASALAVRATTLGMRIPKIHMVAGPLYLESSLIKFLERFLMKADTVIIGGSLHTSHLYKGLGASNGALRSIPYGVDTKKFTVASPTDRSQARAALGIPPHHFVAIMVAYVYAPKSLVHPGLGIKGHETLLNAWSKFRDLHPDSTLVLVGAGFDDAGEVHRNHLRQSIDLDGNSILWLDTVLDVRSMYSAADVSVSPSISENHGAALEAGACGVPSIVSDAGGLPETVMGGMGWIFSRGNEQQLLEALIEAHQTFEDGSLVHRSKATRDFMVERFDSSMLASRVADVVVDAVTRRGLRRTGEGGRATYFCEARFGRDKEGRIAAMDEASSARVWIPYAEHIGNFRLAARVNSRHNSAERSLDGVDIYPLPYYVGFSGLLMSLPRTAASVLRAVAHSRTIVARLPGPIGFLAVGFGRLLNRRVFVEVVGDPCEVLRASGSTVQRRLAGAVGMLMRWCVGQADGGRFVTKKYLQEHYPLRLGAVSMAISDVRLSDDDFSAGYSRSSESKWRLGAVGSQERDYKGHDLAIRALASARKAGIDAHLTLVGHGVEQPALRQLAQEEGVHGSVVFVDSINDRRKLNEFFDGLDILLHPSRTEGLPRVVLESMARSLPVVASAVGGIPELIDPKWTVATNDVAGLSDKIGEMTKLSSGELAEIGSLNFATAQAYHRDVLSEDFSTFLRAVDRDS